MKTIIANVEFLDIARDPAGPIIFVIAQPIEKRTSDCMLCFYLSGSAADALTNDFSVGGKAAVEIEPCFNFLFGRLVRIGFIRLQMLQEDPELSLPKLFGHSSEYRAHYYLSTVQNPTMRAAIFAPYGYQEPFAEFQTDSEQGAP